MNKKKNCSALSNAYKAIKDLDDRLVSEYNDRINTVLKLELDFGDRVTQNTDQLRNEFSQEIETVNSNIKTEVSKAIASVVDEAPEDFDTSKEAADWFQTHGTEAAAMQSAITNLENSLTQEASDRVTQLNNKANKDLSNVTGVLPITKGGTGATAAKNACNAFLNSLDTGASTPEDKDYYVSQYVNGGTTTTTYHRRPVSALWEYIKGKISSVLGLTSSNYGGVSAKATSDSSGNNIVNTYATKSVATTTQNGLMSSSDKSKLDTLVPVGTIFSGLYSVAPTGYLLCDGREVSISSYPNLYNVIGSLACCQSTDSTKFKLPDFRECALVGAGENKTDVIEDHDIYALGEFKDDQFQTHTHSVRVRHSGSSGMGVDNQNAKRDGSITSGEPNSGRYGDVTRGKRKGVNYIIKYQ